MTEEEIRKWQEGWYSINNMLQTFSYAINDLRSEIASKSGSADQLKFFDYIYPSMSDRLDKIERSISVLSADLILLKNNKRKKK